MSTILGHRWFFPLPKEPSFSLAKMAIEKQVYVHVTVNVLSLEISHSVFRILFVRWTELGLENWVPEFLYFYYYYYFLIASPASGFETSAAYTY